MSMIVDAITSTLGIDILQHILQFLQPPLSYFAFSTCSLWYNVGRKECGFLTVSAVELAKLVAKSGYKNLLSYLVSNKEFKSRDKSIMQYAAQGNIECLKYLHENGWNIQQSNMTTLTALIGNIEIMKYLNENGSEWDSLTCKAENGNFDCLKYAYENGCYWNDDTCTGAAKNGKMECLKYVHENGCAWNGNQCIKQEREETRK